MQMSPSQRQAEDAKRVQARLLRRGHNPGPAHYSPQQLSVKSTSTLRELAGLYAFKSTAVRSDLVLQDKGGYDKALEMYEEACAIKEVHDSVCCVEIAVCA